MQTARVQPETDAPEDQPYSNRRQPAQCVERTAAASLTHDCTACLSIERHRRGRKQCSCPRSEEKGCFGRRRGRLMVEIIGLAGVRLNPPFPNLSDASAAGRHRRSGGVALVANLTSDWSKKHQNSRWLNKSADSGMISPLGIRCKDKLRRGVAQTLVAILIR